MDDRSSSSRRTVLKTGAAIGTGLAASMAGCTAAMPPLGQRIRYGRVDVPDPEPPTFEKWVPSPDVGQVSASSTVDYDIAYATPAELAPGEPADDPGRIFLKYGLDYFGVGYRDYDWILDTSHGVVVRAEFDPESVKETVAGTGYESAGTHDEFEFFTRSDNYRGVGVGDDEILFDKHHRSAEVIVENLQALVDARRDRVPRLVEEDDGIASLLESTGARPFAILGGPIGRLREEAERRDLNLRSESMAVDSVGGNTYFVLKGLFGRGQAPSKSQFKDLLKGRDRALEATAVDVSVEGRIATAEIDPDPGELESSERTRYQQITWGFEHDEGTLTVRHEAGQALDAGNVFLTPDGIEASNEHPEITQFAEEYETVDPGSSVDVDVEAVPDEDHDPNDGSPTLFVVFDDGTDEQVMSVYDL
jgi:hypothetical protein